LDEAGVWGYLPAVAVLEQRVGRLEETLERFIFNTDRMIANAEVSQQPDKG